MWEIFLQGHVLSTNGDALKPAPPGILSSDRILILKMLKTLGNKTSHWFSFQCCTLELAKASYHVG
jgi:hypothetical protein